MERLVKPGNHIMNSSAKPIQVLLVDDHSIMRAGLRLLIENRDNLQVVGEASSCSEAVRLATDKKPDIILLDLQLGSEVGLDYIPAILQGSPKSNIILLTALNDTQVHRTAIAMGAMGVVLKEEAAEVLLKAIHHVHGGEVWIERSMMADVLFDKRSATDINPEKEKIASLTVRESEIIVLISEGLKNKEIAERLFITDMTVRNHLAAVFRKLDLHDRLGLAIYAYRHGLAKLP